MFKSAFVALALVAGSLGAASAATRDINVWGAHITVPTYQNDDARDFVEPTQPAFTARGPARFMSLDAPRSNNGYRMIEHAR